MVEGMPTQETLPVVQNNSKNNFDHLKEIFQIDEIGIIRLSKLVPEDSSLEKIFDGEFQRKLDFYKNFLGLQIQVNVVQDEIFAGYKKVSIDIDGTITSAMWKHIFTQMLPELQSLGFQKSFISLSHVKDIPNEVFEDYMSFVNADFLEQKGNVVKDIILWLELAICTKLSQERGYGNPSEFLEGHENFQDALLNLAHLSKMDSEFQEKLEEMYVNLLRYKNPKIQSLLRMLGHNVNENVASKKLIAKTRSKFSISVAKILGSFGKKEEKPKKKIPLLSFRSAKKLLGNGTENKKLEGYKKGDELTENEFTQLNKMFNIDGIRVIDYGSNTYYVDSSYYDTLKNIYLQIKEKIDIQDHTGLSSLEAKHKEILFKMGFDLKELQVCFNKLYLHTNNIKNFVPPSLLPSIKERLQNYWDTLEKYLSNNVTFVNGLSESLGTDVIINGRKNANYKFLIDTTKRNENGKTPFPKEYKIQNGFNLDIFGGVKITEIVLKNGQKTILEQGYKQEKFQITFENLYHGDYSLEVNLKNGDKYVMYFHCDPDYSRNRLDLSDVTLWQVAGKIRVGKMMGMPAYLEIPEGNDGLSGGITDFGSYFDEVAIGVSKDVRELLTSFNGISDLENIFIERKILNIQSLFPENIRGFIDGKIFFDKQGRLHLEAKLDFQEVMKKSDFGVCISSLLKGDFDEGNISQEKEKLTFAEFSEWVSEMQSKLTHYLEKKPKNGVAKLLQDNIETFKNDEIKRKLLLEMIISKNEEFNPDFLDFYRELGKIDRAFRKFYTLSSVPKIEKVQVLKTLLSRNHLHIVDVWEYLNDELKNKFFAPVGELLNYEIAKPRFYELLSGVKKELEYLLGDEAEPVLSVFEGLFGDDNYLALKMDINELPEQNIILRDLKQFFFQCADKREDQIDSSKEKIEARKREITEFIQKSTKETNQICGLVFDYKFDEKGYVTGTIIYKVETFSYGGSPFPKIKFILEGGLSEKIIFNTVDYEGLVQIINNWESYNSFKSQISEEEFKKYFDQKTDEELKLYIGDVGKFLNGNDRRWIFKDVEFGRKFLERCYSLDEKFLKELVIFELGEAKGFEDLLRIKKEVGNFDKSNFISFVSSDIQKSIKDNLLEALKKLDFERIKYYLQLDDNGEAFFQELQKQDFNNVLETLSFTQKYRHQGVIIFQVCVLIDNYILVKPKKPVTLSFGNSKAEHEGSNMNLIKEKIILENTKIYEKNNNLIEIIKFKE